ncbi:MAG: DNA cytosine methyltransferase [Spirirestis rafaelensis WJT71-NPBG6]|jgi:DNA (cytosine-5)-methyltransferase 1|nr:DNA cytosine methyltransferase [Spirirestis rafaelensis WJT71-NPBG6]
MGHWINPKSQIEYRRPVAVDLFAGAGGFSLGIEQAGFDVLVAVEYDPIHACTYCFNFPLTEVLCADVSKVTAEAIKQAANRSWILHHKSGEVGRRLGDKGTGGQGGQDEFYSPLSPPSPCPPLSPSWDGQIDLVFGGPPCQGFSMMGKRELEDDRNSLIFHFCRLVIELNPRYFVMENVPGMAAGKHKAMLSHLINNFEAAGYHIQKGILNAADFGVPQKRRRLFVIGTQQESGVETRVIASVQKLGVNNSFVTLLPSDAKLNNVTGQNAYGVTVGDAIADLPDINDFPELANSDEVLLSKEQLQQLQEKSSSYVQMLRSHPCMRQEDKETRGQGDREDKEEKVTSPPPPNFSYPRLWNPQLLTSSMQTQHQENSKIRFEKTFPGELEAISRLRRLDINSLCYTLRAGTDYLRGSHTSPRPIHPTLARVISVREAARLHSFPDWFRFHQTKWHGFRQVGNAVPPLLAQAIGEKIIGALCVVPSSPQQPLKLGDTQLLRFTPSQAKDIFSL